MDERLKGGDIKEEDGLESKVGVVGVDLKKRKL